MRMSFSYKGIFSFLVMLFVLVRCGQMSGARDADVFLLFDFEHPKDLKRLSWSCKVVYSLYADHATRGRHSLRVDMYPDTYPGFKTRDFPRNWSGFRFLVVDVFNPAEGNLALSYRIDDRPNSPSYEDRVNGTVLLPMGKGRIVLDIFELVTSGTKRHLDTSHIYGLYLFLCSPKEKVTLFLDNIRLVRYPPS